MILIFAVTLSLLVPIFVQMYILLKYSPAVDNRPVWKWLAIYTMGITQSLLAELMLVLLIYSLTGLIYIALAMMVIISLVFDYLNYQIMRERTMIFLPTDLKMLNGIRELLGMVNGWSIIGVGVVIISVLGGAILAELTANEYSLSPNGRWVIGAVSIIFFGQFFRINHPKSFAYKLFRFHWKDHPYHFNQVFGAQFNGFLTQFLVNIDMVVMEQPKNYSAETMNKIFQKYKLISEKYNVNRSEKNAQERVVVILSESLSDPDDLKNVQTSQTVLSNIQSLGGSTFHFNMASGYVGGGTANIEYEVYTGFSNALFAEAMSTPYAHVIPAMNKVNSMIDAFENKIGVHTFTGNLYQRDLVYAKFGFQKFYTTNSSKNKLQSMEKYQFGKYISDASFFSELEYLLEQSQDNTIIAGISMQNHMPFLDAAKQGLLLDKGDMEIDFDDYDAYLTGIKTTDAEIGRFISSLSKKDYPVTVLLYGDHLPNIFSSMDAERHMPVLRKTPGFIWQNHQNKTIDLENFKTKYANKSVGSNALIPLLYEYNNWKVSPFYGLLTELYSKLPAIVNGVDSKSKLGLLDENGKVVSVDELSTEQKMLLNDYKLVQYDQTAGKQYLSRDFFK